MERTIWIPTAGNAQGDGSPARPHIGEALVQAGLLTTDQVEVALERQRKHPYFILGQIIGFLFRIPSSVIDGVYLRNMVFPEVGPAVMRRLEQVAERDRFARQLRPRDFIGQIETEPRGCEVMVIEARVYGAPKDESGAMEGHGITRYVLSQGKVRVHLHFGAQGHEPGTVSGSVQFRHDSVSRSLQLSDEDDHFKAVLYYELRNHYHRLHP